MPITDYISVDILKSEEFIHHEDKEGLKQALVKISPELSRTIIPSTVIANYLGVKKDRVYFFLKHKGLPQRLTIAEMLTTDWSEMIDKEKGDNKRKRTYIKF